MPRRENITYSTARHNALCRALRLAKVDLDSVSIHGLLITRNHIEYDEIQCDERGWLIPTRDGQAVTKRRVIRNPNPRLATR